MTDEDIVNIVNGTDNNAEEDENSNNESETKITHNEGFQALQTPLKYMEQQRDSTSTDVLLLQRL